MKKLTFNSEVKYSTPVTNPDVLALTSEINVSPETAKDLEIFLANTNLDKVDKPQLLGLIKKMCNESNNNG
jgi:hypothetical protein